VTIVATTIVTVVLRTVVPLVPVIVKVYVPRGVEVAVEIVRDEDPEPLAIEVGLRVPVEPLGTPVTVSATVPLNPVPGETSTEKTILLPGFTACQAGVADIEKFGTTTTKVTVEL
jgi:hypothetical protein